MKIGFIGLGKLGLPCAVAMSLKGHDVMGYDVVADNMSKRPRAFVETGPDGATNFNDWLRDCSMRFGSLEQVVRHSEVIFVAVQTPHLPQFEGVTKLGHARADFDYSHLLKAVADLSALIEREVIIVIISTVLPGTIRTRVVPLLSDKARLVYNPSFIAMGTTMRDFLHPEFVLLGVHDAAATATLERLYSSLVDAPRYVTALENAELIKLLYNTFIGMKIAFANVAMEICHKTPGTNVDEVIAGLCLSNHRLISNRYLLGGMGDGGGCHPRDNIALSWYSRQSGLSFDWFENVMLARERQTEWLADLMQSYDLPKTILGYAYKENTNIATGSAALLLRNILLERGHEVSLYDPYIDADDSHISRDSPRVYLIGARHPHFHSYAFVPGSVVLDPWRYLTPTDARIIYLPIGVGAAANVGRSLTVTQPSYPAELQATVL